MNSQDVFRLVYSILQVGSFLNEEKYACKKVNNRHRKKTISKSQRTVKAHKKAKK